MRTWSRGLDMLDQRTGSTAWLIELVEIRG